MSIERLNMELMFKRLAILILTPIFALAFSNVIAQQEETATPDIEEVVVSGVRARLEQSGALKDVIEQTESIGNATLESTQSLSLADALSEAPGADVALSLIHI